MSTVLDEDLKVNTTKDVGAELEAAAFAKKAQRVEMIPVSRIRKSDIALRGVQRQTEKYQLLVDSVRKKGVLNAITVREQKDPETGVIFYGLVDGLQRFTACCDAGRDMIPASIVDLDDAEILEAQLITNLNRIETRPADVSKHLLRILARNPFMTKTQLCERVCQSITWVEQRLGLANLKAEIQELVNTGKIHLTNAYALSKIDESEQVNHVEAAMSESPKTFVPRMKQRVKEIRDARKSGADASKAEFQPVQYMQKVSDVKEEFNAVAVGRALIAKHNITTPLDAWKAALAWILHFDKDSQDEQIREHEAQVKRREEEKAKMKAEREEKKARDAVAAKEAIDKGW